MILETNLQIICKQKMKDFINISGYNIPYDEIRRVIHSEAEKNGTEFYMNDPKMAIDLYHYTTVDAFKSMLDQMKNDKSEDLTFWASNVHYMNDPRELEFFYDELNRILPELENELDIKGIRFSAFSQLKNTPVGIDIDKDIKDNVYNRIFRNAYAVSFSKHKDYLPMWTLYGNNGCGLCLEFDRLRFNEWFKGENEKGIRIVEMNYKSKDSEIWNNLKELYKTYYHRIDEKSEGQDFMTIRRSFISEALLRFSVFMKHPAYSHEDEVRLYDHVIYPGDADDILAKVAINHLDSQYDEERDPDVRVKNGLLIPYKKVRIPISFLQKVIVGPTKYTKLQCNAMEILRRKMNLKFEVLPSSVPFREI